MHTTHTSTSQSRGGSYNSHEVNTRSMQLEIDRLHKRLRRRTSLSFDPSSNDDGDDSYRPKSKTPPSESFLYDKDHHYKQKSKSPSCKGLGNDAMSRALN